MAIRDILVALTIYPDRTPDTAVTGAVAIAAALDARIAAIACEVKIKLPNSLFGNALIDLSALAADEAKKSAANAAHLLGIFNEATRKSGVNAETISEKCYTAEVPDTLVEYARFRDLTILPVPQGDDFDQWYAESIIFGSGRPVLVIPHEWKKRASFKLDTAVVAWDFSKTAARAVADALPLLQKTKHVTVLTVANEKEIATSRSATELAKHLAHHRIEVTVDTADAAGQDIGSVLKSYCARHDADLLVMGAYGHSRLREFILGGATRAMLSQPGLPVLMSH
jgi:nucleotide-binding universal stress UspA family protein